MDSLTALDGAAPALEGVVVAERLRSVELLLERALLGWGTASVVGGAAAAMIGRAAGRPSLVAAGRQHVAWGAVDLGIAAWGRTRRLRRSVGVDSVDEARERTGKLRRLLLVNAGLDVSYVTIGLALVAAPSAILARSPRRLSSGRAIGAAVAVQGTFLLVLDLSAASRLARGGLN